MARGPGSYPFRTTWYFRDALDRAHMFLDSDTTDQVVWQNWLFDSVPTSASITIPIYMRQYRSRRM